MHLCNIPNAYIILQKNKKYTVSTLLTALKNFVTDLVPSEIVCFDNSGKRAGYHTHILIIFDDMHSKEPIHVTSQSHMKLFGWLIIFLQLNSTQVIPTTHKSPCSYTTM